MSDRMKSLGEVIAEMLPEMLAKGAVSPEDAGVFKATSEAEEARHAAQAAYSQAVREARAKQLPVPPAPPNLRGPRNDWLHDGTEVHGEPGYRCIVCKDQGKVSRGDFPVGHPDFGKWKYCECQNDPTIHAARVQQRVHTSLLPVPLLSKRLDTFQRHDGTHDAWQASERFLSHLQHKEPSWLVLFGDVGRGKTHLLAAILRASLQYENGLWFSTPHFLDSCKQEHVDYTTGEIKPFMHDQEWTDKATNIPVLALDEFGASGDTTWSTEKLQKILLSRYERGAWTLISTPLSPEALAVWSPRLWSRFRDDSLVQRALLTGDDYRTKLTREEPA